MNVKSDIRFAFFVAFNVWKNLHWMAMMSKLSYVEQKKAIKRQKITEKLIFDDPFTFLCKKQIFWAIICPQKNINLAKLYVLQTHIHSLHIL